MIKQEYIRQTKIPFLSVMALIVKTAPVLFGLSLLLTFLDGLIVPLMIVYVAKFINAALTMTSEHQETFRLLMSSVVIVLSYVYVQFSKHTKTLFFSMLEERFRYNLKPEVIRKQYAIDYSLFEEATTQNLIYRVTTNIESKLVAVIQTVFSFIRIGIQVISTLYILAFFLKWKLLFFLLVFIPLLYISFRGGVNVYSEEKKINLITRKMNYLSEILTDRASSAERKLFGFSNTINKRFEEAHLYRSNHNTIALAREVSRSKLINVVINLMLVPLMLVLAREVQNNRLSVGLFTSILGSSISLSKIISSQLSDLFLQLASHSEYAKDFKAFMILDENSEVGNHADECIEFNSLVIKDLWFRYQGSSDYVLKGVNLAIESGKSYSMVGVNGAGKTTLIKILTGLYRTFEGQILINNKDIRTYSFNQLRNMFSIVSQDYAKYFISVKDNILLGDENKDITKILNELEMSSFVDHLEEKENTVLGKLDKSGVDLSGGQWQKVAIARAVMKGNPFIIMDEPTSSLSPSAESKIYANFIDIAKDKTMLMISHRLGSTKIADEIIVLNEGVVIECDTHENLMKDKTLYSELFNKQSRLYDEK